MFAISGSDSTNLFWGICIGGIVLAGLCKSLYSHHMLKTNPEAWRAMKAAEEDAKERKRNAVGKTLLGGAQIARMFWRR
jgi:hypothetical protein